MIPLTTWAQFAVAVAAAVLCLVFAIRKRKPGDLTAGAVLVVEVLLVLQLIGALIAPAFGNGVAGDPLEFWMYVVVALLIPPAGIVWAMIDRAPSANAVLAVAAFTVGVMVVRMQQIWLGAAPLLGA